MAKRNCTRLSIKEKIEIIRYFELNTLLSDQYIANMFSEKFKKSISRRSINDLKKTKNNVLKSQNLTNPERHRVFNLKFNVVDKNLLEWIEHMEGQGAILNDGLLMEKASSIAQKNSIKEFKASQGWLNRFKSRHNLTLKALHGESFTSQQVDYTEFLEHLNKKIQEYGVENVFNADESGLFYKIIPSKSVCKNVGKGYKLLKDRISILFCTNITGTIKHKPLIIGLSKNPGALNSLIQVH